MARILCSDPINAICPEILQAAGHDVTSVSTTLSHAELVQQIENYDALIVRSGSIIDREVLHAAIRLQLIGRAGTGVDNIDVVTATKQGILVMNTPFGNTMSAAELTLGLLTSLSQSSATNTTRSSEIHDKTIGIIGLGRIGREVASRCNAFGMNVIGYDPIVSDTMAKSHAIEPVSLNELFARSDYITLHVPLNANTKQLVNASRLALCKDGVKLINTARAGLMDVEAVLEALEQGKLAKVAFDIIPPSSSSPTWQKLVTHPHVILTPHIGALTLEAQSRVAHDIAVSVDAALQGTSFPNVLNAPNIDLEHRQEQLPFLSLGEKVGSMQAQLLSSESRIERITIISEGRKLTSDTTVSSLLVNSVLKGLFSHFLEEPVTLETARSLAEGMGIHCVEQKHEEVLTSSSYASLLTVKVDVVGQTSSSMTIAGTVFGKSQLRLVALNGLSLDAIPNGSMLFFNNTDAPGVLHTVTSVLAQHSINIGCFGLARDALGGQAVGVLNVDEPIPDHVMEELHALDTVTNLRQVNLLELDTKRWITPSSSPSMLTTSDVEIVTDKKPNIRPQSPNFGSGPCKKRPGYSLSRLSEQCLGRSHRSKLGKGLLEEAILRSKALLGLPSGYEVGIVPASDTGAFEMAMWNFLSNERPIDVCYWESFGKQWFTDITKELELTNVQEYTAPFGSLPDLTQTNPHHDVVFTWNGTTSGVCVPDGNWISNERTGLVFNDATSAAFAMDIPWDKIDVCTFSWQKVLGGEGGHGILILSPRAIERLEQNGPPKRPMPKIFRLTDRKSGQLLRGIFEGSTINTPSMLCVEDYLDALRWAETMGGVSGLIALSKRNLAVIEEFVEKNGRWIQFLAQTRESRSNTSVCLQFPEFNKDQVKEFQKLLEIEKIAYDIGSYRDAPPGIRIWCGATVETKDLEALMPWIKWAYHQVKEKENKE